MDREITIRLTESDDELYEQYPNQHSRQPAILRLDLEDGVVDAYVWGEIGGGRSMRAFNGLDREWSIPPLKVDALARLVEAVRPYLETVYERSEVYHDGNNLVGRVDEEGFEAEEAIRAIIDDEPWGDCDVWEVWDAGDWLFSNCEDLATYDLTAESSDQEIEEKADGLVAEADVVIDRDDVVAELTERRDRARDEAAEDEDEEDVDPVIAAAKRIYTAPPLRRDQWAPASRGDLQRLADDCGPDDPDIDHERLNEAVRRRYSGEAVFLAVDEDGPFVVWASEI